MPFVADPNFHYYGDDALETLRRAGHRDILIRCLNRRCSHFHTLPIDELIATYGPGYMVYWLAKRLRCQFCKRYGAHISFNWLDVRRFHHRD